ncbi:hypothetical protein [Chitinophaga sp.]|uniref:hypothetical protein n=1 Tax=Chitinophaga sp. TaxID=1869181 RepID=UPI0031D6B06A
MTTYTTYRIFESREEAAAMQALLSRNRIPNSMEEGKPLFDTPIVGALNTQQYFVKIPQEKFLIANEVLESAVDLNELEVEDDYYLLSFTDEELLDLVKKKDEWGEFDYALARKLLAERGIPLTTSDLQLMQVEREQDLKTPEKAGGAYIWGGYIAAVVNTILGVAVGLILMTAYRKMPDGTTVAKFDESTRRHGKWIFVLSIAVALGHCAFLFYKDIPFSPAKVIFWAFGRRFF